MVEVVEPTSAPAPMIVFMLPVVVKPACLPKKELEPPVVLE